jgi:hypothetical protein
MDPATLRTLASTARFNEFNPPLVRPAATRQRVAFGEIGRRPTMMRAQDPGRLQGQADLALWSGRRGPVVGTVDPGVDMKTPPKTQVDTMPAGKFFPTPPRS